MTARRTVIQSSGLPRRAHLSQPPHFRIGLTPAPAADQVALCASAAIKASQLEALARAQRRIA